MLTNALNNAIKLIAILLGILWTIAAIPPVINTYYYIDELSCTDEGCQNYEMWNDDEEIMLLQEEITDLQRGLDTCNALIIDNIKK
jgi:hypothetical protein|tara:strand:+ start:147 stop:404 length:258 start_codon:yes stop_codon:yes gene_type:complete